MHLKDELMPRYAKLVYTGYWWSPPSARCCRRPSTRRSCRVNGTVRLKLYKGLASVVGPQVRRQPLRCDYRHLRGRLGAYNQKDAEGFIRLNAPAPAYCGTCKGRKLG
jgi:argininosuccinate synthase